MPESVSLGGILSSRSLRVFLSAIILILCACQAGRPGPTRQDDSAVDCTSSFDCPGEEQCVGGICQSNQCGNGASCSSSFDCPLGYCDLVNGVCVECLVTDHCAVNFVCNPDGCCEGELQGGDSDPGDSGGGDSGGGDSGGGDSGGGDSGGGDSGGGDSGGGDDTPEPASELSICADTSACATGLACVPYTKDDMSRCVRSCSVDSECPAGSRCQNTGTAGLRCLGDDVGRPCTLADECNFACLTNPGYCTNLCATGADCANGFGCMPVGTDGTRVCIRVEAYCDSSDTSACIAPSACDLSAGQLFAGTLGGCTIACDTASDCPQRAPGLAPWTCDGLCRRPAGIYGPQAGGSYPVSYSCNESSQVVNICNDGQILDFETFTIPTVPSSVDCGALTEAEGFDGCVNTCTYQGGCPYGFSCVAIGQVAAGSRAGLCLPQGTQFTSLACSDHWECRFGYCVDGVCSRDCTDDGLCPHGLSCQAVTDVPVNGQTFRRCQ